MPLNLPLQRFTTKDLLGYAFDKKRKKDDDEKYVERQIKQMNMEKMRQQQNRGFQQQEFRDRLGQQAEAQQQAQRFQRDARPIVSNPFTAQRDADNPYVGRGLSKDVFGASALAGRNLPSGPTGGGGPSGGRPSLGGARGGNADRDGDHRRKLKEMAEIAQLQGNIENSKDKVGRMRRLRDAEDARRGRTEDARQTGLDDHQKYMGRAAELMRLQPGTTIGSAIQIAKNESMLADKGGFSAGGAGSRGGSIFSSEAQTDAASRAAADANNARQTAEDQRNNAADEAFLQNFQDEASAQERQDQLIESGLDLRGRGQRGRDRGGRQRQLKGGGSVGPDGWGKDAEGNDEYYGFGDRGPALVTPPAPKRTAADRKEDREYNKEVDEVVTNIKKESYVIDTGNKKTTVSLDPTEQGKLEAIVNKMREANEPVHRIKQFKADYVGRLQKERTDEAILSESKSNSLEDRRNKRDLSDFKNRFFSN